MQSRLFSPVAGRLIVVNLIAEIRAITREYLVSQYNWVFETSQRPNDLHTVIDDVASWYDNASGVFQTLSCMWPFGGPSYRINDLKQLFAVARDIEDYLHNLIVEINKLKDCISDRGKFEYQQAVIQDKKNILMILIAVHLATLFRQVNMRMHINAIADKRDQKDVEIYEFHLRTASHIRAEYNKPLFCKHFTYEDIKGTKKSIPVSGLLGNFTGNSTLADKLVERVLGYHKGDYYVDENNLVHRYEGYITDNFQFDLSKIDAAITHDIDMEFSACERQLAAVEQVIHAKVEPVRADNFRLKTELATKEQALTAADTKLKITEAERDSTQQMAATLADRQLAEKTSANNATLTQLTDVSADTSLLRSRRKK
jgi:hypothetical protein